MSSSVTALIVAGEASGDQHAAALAARVSQQKPVSWFGLGGDCLQAAGVTLVEHARTVNVLGLSEVVRHLPRIYRVFRHLLREVDRRQPQLAVLVNFPDFNLRLARQLHARKIPVVYFIPPQVWAWRSGRLRSLKRTVRKVLCIFPFEEHIYQRAGIEVEYVGHPLADHAVATLTSPEFSSRHGLDAKCHLVCLLPGSRNQEVIRHLPTLVSAAQRLHRRLPVQFMVVRASTVDSGLLHSLLPASLGVRVVDGPVYNALAASSAAVVASGTATLEAALMETPMVVIYRVSAATWWLGRRMVHTPHYSMVNIIAGKPVVPELIQQDFTPQRVAEEVEALIQDRTRREAMKQELRSLRAEIGRPGAIERASRAVLDLLAQSAPAPVPS